MKLPSGMVEIYREVTYIECKKGPSGEFANEEFYHDFGENGDKPPSLYGLPVGTIVTLPGGEEMELAVRSELLLGDVDHWFDQDTGT